MVNYFTISADDEKLQLTIDKFEVVQENTDIIKVNLKFDNGDDKIMVNGQVEQKVDLNNDYQVNLNLFI